MIMFECLEFTLIILYRSLFMGLLNGPIMQNLQKVQGRIERKICAVGMTRLLTKSEKVMGSEYAEVW